MDVRPYQLGIYQNEVYLSYRVHLADVFSSHQTEVGENITAMFNKANELDDYFVNKYNCKYSAYSLKNKVAVA